MISDKISPFLEPSIFQEIGKVIREHNAINIASGAPDWEPPKFLKDNIVQAINENFNQYGLPGGQPQLKLALTNIFQSQITQFDLKPEHFYISNGASGIIFDVMQILLNPGDEVVFFDPHFPQHRSNPLINGAVPKSSNLIPPKNKNDTWQINFEEFQSLFTEKTKLLILCSPNNPTGKIFTLEEYQKIEQILLKFPKVLVLSDEVYDFLVFDQKKFVKFANISKEMAQRTITAGSLGKTMSCTGWRCGFAISPNPEIIKGLVASCANNFYSTVNPVQMAFSYSLDYAYNQTYKNNLTFCDYSRSKFEENRNFVETEFQKLEKLNWSILPTEGGYFTMINIQNLIPKIPEKYFYKNSESNKICNKPYRELENPDFPADVGVSKFFAIELGVAVLPTSSFYIKENKESYFIRISLSKKLTTLQKALEQLQKY